MSAKAKTDGSRIDFFKGDNICAFCETISINKDNGVLFGHDVNAGKICLSKIVSKGALKEELKEEIIKTANNLEEAYNIIQKEGMLYRVGKDGNYSHVDVASIIQQMKDFASSY